MNEDGIPGPRGAMWRDTAIRGHRGRGTGILNNELYIGRLIWNRLRYVKDPKTGKRVSRQNPKSDWVIEDVPELRIVSDELWDKAKSRQAEIDQSPQVQAIKSSRFWEKRRAKYLLTKRVKCAECGGAFIAVGRDYLACTNARKLNTCINRNGIRRAHLEEFVVNLLRDSLMEPRLVKEFVAAYHKEINASRRDEEIDRRRIEAEQSKVKQKIEGLYDAIADGFRTPGLKNELVKLEAISEQLQDKLNQPVAPPIRMHPNLAEVYRKKVAALGEMLHDPTIRDETINILRPLIDRIVLNHNGETWEVELVGQINAMVNLGTTNKLGTERHYTELEESSIKVVAGVGFEPTTFRL